jgi:hypothetical protein
MNPFTALLSMGLKLHDIQKSFDVLHTLKKCRCGFFSSFQTTKSESCARGDARD